MAIGLLIDEGKLSLDENIYNIFPGKVNPLIKIFRPEIIAKDAAMVITPIPAILLYTPLCALNYKSKGVKKVEENAYLY